MSIIYIMIPLALLLVALAIWAMIWAVRSGQFDELESHGWTPILDDDQRPRPVQEDSPAYPATAAADDDGDAGRVAPPTGDKLRPQDTGADQGR